MVLMDAASGPPGAPRPQLSSLSLPIFVEGVSLVLSRWTALQMAVNLGWGGRDARWKVHKLESRIVSWFTQSNGTLEKYVLKDRLKNRLLHSFHTEIQDHSDIEVAEHLMIIYKECLQGNYASIEKLKTSKSQAHAVSQSIRVINYDEDESSDDENESSDDEDESSDDEASDMIVDGPKPNAAAVDKPKPGEVPDEEGWTVVSSKRERGRRPG